MRFVHLPTRHTQLYGPVYVAKYGSVQQIPFPGHNIGNIQRHGKLLVGGTQLLLRFMQFGAVQTENIDRIALVSAFQHYIEECVYPLEVIRECDGLILVQ